ncbi:MAG TPA: hypothetical protein VFX97_09480 [Pyrinomonadaceae bacterium]|nr:hypothetical protein [Pyrinomonadaceae bacterium]
MNSGAKLFKALAITLMLWCAGAGCVLVRSAQATHAAAGDSAAADSTNHGEMGASQHAACHAKQGRRAQKEANSRPQITKAFEQRNTPRPGRPDAMSCCPLVNGLFVTSSRNQTHDDASVLAPNDSTSFALANLSPTPPDVPLRLPDKHHLYLRGCAFLI